MEPLEYERLSPRRATVSVVQIVLLLLLQIGNAGLCWYGVSLAWDAFKLPPRPVDDRVVFATCCNMPTILVQLFLSAIGWTYCRLLADDGLPFVWQRVSRGLLVLWPIVTLTVALIILAGLRF